MGTLIHAPLDQTAEPIAAGVGPVVFDLFDEPPPIVFEFWDGSVVGDDIAGRLRFTSPTAFRHIMWSPDELGLARAYVAGDVDVTGNVAELLRALQQAHRPGSAAALRAAPEAIRAIRAAGGVGTRPPVPDEEVVPRGVRHSPRRDPTGGQPPLRRRQPLLRTRARARHDVLVRPVRHPRHVTGRCAGRQTRVDLPEVGPRRWFSTCAR